MQIEAITRMGFVPVPYPTALRACVRQAMKSWKDFCQLRQEDKQQLSLGDRIKDIGYVLRDEKGLRKDSKKFFHANLIMPDEVKARARDIFDQRAVAFIDATDVLLAAIEPTIQAFAREVEGQFDLSGFESEVMKSQKKNWTFRYLHYFPSDEGIEIAHAHTDRGGFTLHMSESHPGAEYLGFDKNWKPLPVSESETIIFPSMGLQYRSDSKLKALCHRVLATPEAAREGRYSMVGFIDFITGHRFNDAQFRLQDFEPGFNYQMSDEEFKKFFIPR